MSLNDILAAVVSRSQGEVTTQRTGSAMTPVNYFAGIGSAACFATGVAFKGDPLAPWLIGAGLAVLAVAGAIALYFAVFQPDRLQTEEHIARLEQLDIIRAKGRTVPMTPVNLAEIGQVRPALAGKAVAAPEGDAGE